MYLSAFSYTLLTLPPQNKYEKIDLRNPLYLPVLISHAMQEIVNALVIFTVIAVSCMLIEPFHYVSVPGRL